MSCFSLLQRMASNRWRLSLALLLLTCLSVVACSEGVRPLTSYPTPTPTPTPLLRINVSNPVTFGDLVTVIPTQDAECLLLKAQAQDSEEFLAQEVPFFDMVILSRSFAQSCFGNEAKLLLLVAGLEQEAGRLSDPSVTCLRRTLGTVNIQGDHRGISAQTNALPGIAVGLLLCLTNEEAERIVVSSVMADVPELPKNLTLEDLRCFLEGSDLQTLSSTLGQVIEGKSLGSDIGKALEACAGSQ